MRNWAFSLITGTCYSQRTTKDGTRKYRRAGPLEATKRVLGFWFYFVCWVELFRSLFRAIAKDVVRKVAFDLKSSSLSSSSRRCTKFQSVCLNVPYSGRVVNPSLDNPYCCSSFSSLKSRDRLHQGKTMGITQHAS